MGVRVKEWKGAWWVFINKRRVSSRLRNSFRASVSSGDSAEL